VIPLRKTPSVVRGEDKPPCCEHGEWRFAGADHKALAPLGVRRIERVRLRADLTIMAQLTCALNRERAVALAA
jgi:hypothetical protein